MKIGLLICDHVSSEFLHIAGDYSDMFQKFLPNTEWVHYDVIRGQFPKDIHECQAYLCTGSRHSVYEDLPWIHELKSLILHISRSNLNFIGVCFGHQMMGEALGGKVGKSSQGWCVGNQQFLILQKMEWMIPWENTIRLQMMCQDQIIRLPGGATSIASTAECAHAIISIGQNMLGVQGHPEFTAEYSNVLLTNRIQRIGESKVKAAQKSFSDHSHDVLFRSWITHFLTS